MKNKELGYTKEQTLLIPLNNSDIYTKRDVFKNELVRKGFTTSASAMSGEPGGFFDTQIFEIEGKKNKRNNKEKKEEEKK